MAQDIKAFILLDFALTLTRIASYDDLEQFELCLNEARNALERWKDQEHLWKERGGR